MDQNRSLTTGSGAVCMAVNELLGGMMNSHCGLDARGKYLLYFLCSNAMLSNCQVWPMTLCRPDENFKSAPA